MYSIYKAIAFCYSIYGKKSLISSASQQLIEIDFVVQLQTLHEISLLKNNFGELDQ